MISIDRIIPYPLQHLSIRHDFRTGRYLDSFEGLNGKLRFGLGRQAIRIDDKRISDIGAGDFDVTFREECKDSGREEYVVFFRG